MTEPRYSVGFRDPGTACDWVERNKGYPPIVDYGTPFVLGAVIALCDCEETAKRIVYLLNSDRNMRYGPRP